MPAVLFAPLVYVHRNVLETLLEQDDFEGLVAKGPRSPYRGGRTLSWLKVKRREYRVEKCGWDATKSRGAG